MKNKILISLDIKFFIDIKRFFAEAGAGMNYPYLFIMHPCMCSYSMLMWTDQDVYKHQAGKLLVMHDFSKKNRIRSRVMRIQSKIGIHVTGSRLVVSGSYNLK